MILCRLWGSWPTETRPFVTTQLGMILSHGNMVLGTWTDLLWTLPKWPCFIGTWWQMCVWWEGTTKPFCPWKTVYNQIIQTYTTNDLYFWRSTPQNKALSIQNKGHQRVLGICTTKHWRKLWPHTPMITRKTPGPERDIWRRELPNDLTDICWKLSSF